MSPSLRLSSSCLRLRSHAASPHMVAGGAPAVLSQSPELGVPDKVHSECPSALPLSLAGQVASGMEYSD